MSVAGKTHLAHKLFLLFLVTGTTVRGQQLDSMMPARTVTSTSPSLNCVIQSRHLALV